MVTIIKENVYMKRNIYNDASIDKLVSVLQNVAQLASQGFSVSIRNIPMDRVQNIIIDITQASNDTYDLIGRYTIAIDK